MTNHEHLAIDLSVNDPSRGEGKPLGFLLKDHPPVEKPLMLFEPVHSSGIQMVFSNSSSSFGLGGEAFIAQIGTDAPISQPPPVPGNNNRSRCCACQCRQPNNLRVSDLVQSNNGF